MATTTGTEQAQFKAKAKPKPVHPVPSPRPPLRRCRVSPKYALPWRRPRLPSTVPPLPAPTLLNLMWLASPALPVGGFSYSEGLESAVDAGLVRDEATASTWLLAQLQLGLSRSDLPTLAQAHRACVALLVSASPVAQQTALAELQAANDWLRQTRETAEFRAQQAQMGRSLMDWLRNSAHAVPAAQALAHVAALPGGPLWPTVFALATALAQATPRDALLAFAWGWAENMAQAAMKAVPLGQAAAQRMLTRLAADLPAAVDAALLLPPQDRQAFSPMLAILSAQHEAQYSRLFRS